MKVRETLKALLKTAAENDLQHVLRLRPLLEDGIRRFGDREVADVLTTELEPLARQHADILRLDQNVEAKKRSWDEKWQQYYYQRFVLKQSAYASDRGFLPR